MGDGRWRMGRSMVRCRVVRWSLALHIDPLLNLAELTAAADKAENEARVLRQSASRRQQGVERVARTVISRIHHHKFPLQSVGSAEPFASFGIEVHFLVVRPGGNDGD